MKVGEVLGTIDENAKPAEEPAKSDPASRTSQSAVISEQPSVSSVQKAEERKAMGARK
jgi:hypothetical protein